MNNRSIYHQNRLIQIFRDHWEPFKRFYPHLVNVDIEANVQKMMDCGLLANGYAEYRCRCGHIKRVPFSCKSRFCLRCAKVYIDKWVAKMKETVFAKINHRHIILTVPGSLWKYFHSGEMLKLLADCGAKLVKEVSKICLKGKEIDLGIILVTQTAGRSSTWNPHLHLLVTEGGLDKNNQWKEFYYFDYQILRKKWMYILLGALKETLVNDFEAIRLIDEVFQKRGSVGLIVRAKKEKVRKTDIIGYLIKYVAAPPIALYRITGYDGRSVKYWYREHPTDRQVYSTVSVYEFIARLIQHIPAKGVKMVRHYGLYARVKIKQVKEIIDKIFSYVKSVVQEFSSLIGSTICNDYRSRIKKSFGVDPFICPECQSELILYQVWHPKYGAVYQNDNWLNEITAECCEENTCSDPAEAGESIGEENGSSREYHYLSLCEMPISN